MPIFDLSLMSHASMADAPTQATSDETIMPDCTQRRLTHSLALLMRRACPLHVKVDIDRQIFEDCRSRKTGLDPATSTLVANDEWVDAQRRLDEMWYVYCMRLDTNAVLHDIGRSQCLSTYNVDMNIHRMFDDAQWKISSGATVDRDHIESCITLLKELRERGRETDDTMARLQSLRDSHKDTRTYPPPPPAPVPVTQPNVASTPSCISSRVDMDATPDHETVTSECHAARTPPVVYSPLTLDNDTPSSHVHLPDDAPRARGDADDITIMPCTGGAKITRRLMTRDNRLTNHRRAWTAQEVRMLLRLRKKRHTWGQIANALGRTVSAVSGEHADYITVRGLSDTTKDIIRRMAIAGKRDAEIGSDTNLTVAVVRRVRGGMQLHRPRGRPPRCTAVYSDASDQSSSPTVPVASPLNVRVDMDSVTAPDMEQESFTDDESDVECAPCEGGTCTVDMEE